MEKSQGKCGKGGKKSGKTVVHIEQKIIKKVDT